MAGPYYRTYTNFAGGQNNKAGAGAGPVVIDNGGTEALAYAHSSTNWEMAEDGLLKYAGDAAVLTSPAASIVTGEYDWNGIHILCKGGKVYTVSGTTETQIYTGHTAGKFYQFTEWDNGSGTEILIMCNGTDTPLQYNGATCTTIAYTDDASGIWNNAKPQGAMVFGGSIFYWGDPTYPHRWYKPRPGTHNNFDNTENSVDSGDVDAGFGGVITGMKALTDDLAIIYKERAIRRMSGVNPFGTEVDPISIRPVTDEFGCIAPRTLVQVGINHYFLSEDGYRQFRPIQSYGDIDPQQPTYPIQDIIDALNYDSSVIVNACAVFHKASKQIWLSVPYGASSTNNLIIIHDTVTGGNDPRLADDIAASTLSTFNRKVYSGGYNGQVYKHGDDYNYHGTAVAAVWESKYIAHNGIGRLKKYKEMHIFAESDGEGSLVCQYIVLKRGQQRTQSSTQEIQSGDNAWDTATWDEAVWGEGGEQIFKISDLGEGNAIKFRFINNANNQRVKIRAVELHYDLLGSARG